MLAWLVVLSLLVVGLVVVCVAVVVSGVGRGACLVVDGSLVGMVVVM